MNAQAEQLLLEKLKALPPERRAEVEDFVDFLAAKARKQAAFDRQGSDANHEIFPLIRSLRKVLVDSSPSTPVALPPTQLDLA